MHNYPKHYTIEERLELYQLALDDLSRTMIDGHLKYAGLCVYYGKECNVYVHIGNVLEDPDYTMDKILPELWDAAINDKENNYNYDWVSHVFLTYPYDPRRLDWLKKAIDIVKQKIE